MTDGGTAGWEAADGFWPGNDFRILMGGDLTSSASPTGILAFGLCLLVFPFESFWRFCIGRWSAWDVGLCVLRVWALRLGFSA